MVIRLINDTNADTNCLKDAQQLKRNPKLNSNSDTWTTSRYFSSAWGDRFGLFCIDSNGAISSKRLVDLFPSQNIVKMYSVASGMRPIITLKDNVRIVNGKGTLEEPYILEIQ